jgi:hypothetical protein
MRSPVNRHRLWQVAVDAALIAAAWIISWYVRFDADWRATATATSVDVVALVVGVTLPVFIAFSFQPLVADTSRRDMGVLRGVAVAVIRPSSFTLDFHREGARIWVIDLLLLAFAMEAAAHGDAHGALGRSVVARGRSSSSAPVTRQLMPADAGTRRLATDRARHDDPRKKNLGCTEYGFSVRPPLPRSSASRTRC